MSTTPLVVVFPRGQLSPKDKERFTKAGIIAVEADDPKAVVQLQLAQPLVLSAAGLSADAFVLALLESLADQSPQTSGGSINSIGVASHAFIRRLAASLKPKEPRDA